MFYKYIVQSLGFLINTFLLFQISDMRVDYNASRLEDHKLPTKDPFLLFQLWFQEAVDHPSIKEANAMNLATASK